MRPYSPVHVRGRRDVATGDLTITWVRRARIGGDSWDGIDAPLGEENEAYAVEILDEGGAVLRTLNASAPSAVYTAAMQQADWGAVPANPVPVKVYQLSVAFGRGTGRRVVLDV